MKRSPITHVAVRFQGTVYALPRPNRHNDVLRSIVAETGAEHVDPGDEDEGFLDAEGRFLSRRQAVGIARMHGQIKDPNKVRAGELTSEDLW